MRVKHKKMFRTPRTTQEKRVNSLDSEWCRAKRKPNNLPNAWDDIFIRHRRTWKDVRKKQYKNRGKKHCIIIITKHHTNYWELANWFDKHDISYKIDRLSKNILLTWWSNKDINIDKIMHSTLSENVKYYLIVV